MRGSAFRTLEHKRTAGLTSKWTTLGRHLLQVMVYSRHHLEAIHRKWPHEYSLCRRASVSAVPVGLGLAGDGHLCKVTHDDWASFGGSKSFWRAAIRSGLVSELEGSEKQSRESETAVDALVLQRGTQREGLFGTLSHCR